MLLEGLLHPLEDASLEVDTVRVQLGLEGLGDQHGGLKVRIPVSILRSVVGLLDMGDEALMVDVLGFLFLRSGVAVQLLFLFPDHLSHRVAVLLVLLKGHKGSAIVHTGIEMLNNLSVKVVDPVHWQLEVGEVIQVAF